MLLDFFGIDIPPAESVVDGAGNQEKKEGIVESMGKLSDEKKKEIDEKLFESVSTDLTKQYGLNLDEKLPDGTTKGEKLRSILRKRAESAYSIFVDEHNVVNINAKNLAELTGSGVGIVYDLIKEGVFGVSNMTFDFVNTAEGTVRYVVRSVSGKELSPGMGGAISLDAISDNMTASEKMFLLAIFYRKGGFVTSMLGEIGFILAQPMRLLNSFDNIGTRSVWIP